MIGFYDHPDSQMRHSSWKLLECLNPYFNLPWVVFGEFNEITHLEEKSGWLERDVNKMLAFWDSLEACGLADLGFSRPHFTWCNCRLGEERTLIKLDRMVANNEWMDLFPDANVQHRSMSTFDHCLLILYPKSNRLACQRKQRFRFKSMWIRDESCKEVVESMWVLGTNFNGNPLIQDTIKECQSQLQWWNKNILSNINK